MQYPALYFPYIHIRDDNWLKAAALYWPYVSRIVPSDYPKHDSSTSKVFAAADVLQDEHPGWLFQSAAFSLVGALEANIDAVADRYNIGQAYATRNQTGLRAHDEWQDTDLAWIHLEKVPTRVVELLTKRMVAVRGRGYSHGHSDPANWIGLHPALAAAYMTALAGQICHEGGFEPLTDETDLRFATPNDDVQDALRLLLGGDPSEHRSATDGGTEMYVMLALKQVLPANLDSVKPETIIKCRDSLTEELTDFRNYVTGMQKELIELAQIASERHRIERFAQHTEATIKQPIDRLERGLNKHGVDTTVSLLTTNAIAPPLVAETAAQALGSSLSPVAALGVGAVALVSTAWWTTRGRRFDSKERSPVSYLLDVRNQLDPDGVLGRAQRLASRAP